MKAVGGLLIAVGIILGIIVAVWTRGIGFYQHELPAIAVLGILAFGGIFGGIALHRNASPNGRTPTASAWRPPLVPEEATVPISSTIEPSVQLDADLSAEDLARLAAERPDLWHAIAAHPQCYPALSTWIAEPSAGQAPTSVGVEIHDELEPAPISAASEVVEDEAWTAARTTAEDPGAEPADLASIAQHYPDLRAAVAQNPAAYPELREWITAVRRERHG